MICWWNKDSLTERSIKDDKSRRKGSLRRLYHVIIICPFSLMRRDRRIKAKMNGPPHSRPKCLTLRSRSTFCEGKRQAPLREGQAFSSSLGQAPLPFWPGPRALPGRGLAFPHTVSVVFTFTLNDTLPPPNPHGGQGSAIPYTARGLNPRRRFASSRTK